MKTVVWCTIRKLEGILSIADFSLEVNLKNFGFQCDISQFSNFDHIIMDFNCSLHLKSSQPEWNNLQTIMDLETFKML